MSNTRRHNFNVRWNTFLTVRAVLRTQNTYTQISLCTLTTYSSFSFDLLICHTSHLPGLNNIYYFSIHICSQSISCFILWRPSSLLKSAALPIFILSVTFVRRMALGPHWKAPGIDIVSGFLEHNLKMVPFPAEGKSSSSSSPNANEDITMEKGREMLGNGINNFSAWYTCICKSSFITNRHQV